MTYTHLVISGGGIKGIAIIGALTELDNRKLLDDIANYCGASVGGLICLLMNIGYTMKELYDILMNIDFSRYQTIKILDLIENWGVDNGELTMKLIETIVKIKGYNKDTTFKELFAKTKKTLIITGSELYTNTEKSYDAIGTPDMKILDAIRITISYPCYYYPVIDNKKTEILIDGALYNPYPISYFKDVPDFKKNVIGLFLHRNHGIEKISNIDQFMMANILNLIERYEKFFIKGYEDCTIILDLEEYNAMNFNISREIKELMFNCGIRSARKFLD